MLDMIIVFGIPLILAASVWLHEINAASLAEAKARRGLRVLRKANRRLKAANARRQGPRLRRALSYSKFL